MTDFDREYAEWTARVLIKFGSDYPNLADYRCEVGESGTVYVHTGDAYPLEFRGYEEFTTEKGSKS